MEVKTELSEKNFKYILKIRRSKILFITGNTEIGRKIEGSLITPLLWIGITSALFSDCEKWHQRYID